MITVYLQKSTDSKKKFMVTIISKNKHKTVHFGASGYSDYTIHKDYDRMQRYDARHKTRENWNKTGLYTAGFWSKWLLWSKPSLTKSINYTEAKFNIKIYKKAPPKELKSPRTVYKTRSKNSPRTSKTQTRTKYITKTRARYSSKKKKIAVKTNPKLWENCKTKACTKAGLCKHSARKMQWATNCYKKNGGTYKDPKTQNNSLKLWGEEKWRTYDGKKSSGKTRYLPSKAWEKLSPEQIRRTNRKKEEGFKKGKQYVKNPKDVVEIAKHYRTPHRRSL